MSYFIGMTRKIIFDAAEQAYNAVGYKQGEELRKLSPEFPSSMIAAPS